MRNKLLGLSVIVVLLCTLFLVAPVETSASTITLGEPQGVNDDEAIQAALDMDKKVELQEGVYIIDDPLILTPNDFIQGAGVGLTIIRLADGANCNVFQTEGEEAHPNIRIENLQVDGNKENNSGGSGIFLQFVSRLLIRDVKVTDCADYGIYIGKGEDKGLNNHLDTVMISKCGNTGLRIDNASTDTRVRFTSVYWCAQEEGYSVQLEGCGNTQFYNLHLSSPDPMPNGTHLMIGDGYVTWLEFYGLVVDSHYGDTAVEISAETKNKEGINFIGGVLRGVDGGGYGIYAHTGKRKYINAVNVDGTFFRGFETSVYFADSGVRNSIVRGTISRRCKGVAVVDDGHNNLVYGNIPVQ